MTLGSGTVLNHYRLRDKLGEGGMGVVWRATDSHLDRDVAIKVLPAELALDPERLERFQVESKAIAALNHPNIVTIYSVEEAEGQRFITMELIDGKQLSDVIPTGGMPPDQLLEIAIPVADAVASAHRRGILHRDLKPANIMIARNGRPKILDFGLAKREPNPHSEDTAEMPTIALTQAGRLLGTVPYMSPEQVKGRATDQRSDIFSLGSIFFEMATGQRPFDGESSAEMISSILRDRPTAISSTNPTCPPQLERVLNRSLEKDPARRIQTADDLSKELKAVQRGIISGDISLTGAHTPTVSQRLRRAGWASGIAAALIVLSVAVVWIQRRPSVEAEEGSQQKSRVAGADVTTGQNEASIAVLPFDNLSNDPENEYFSDGMTEEIIQTLSRIEGLDVAARTSVFALKGTDLTTQQVSSRLGVAKVLGGSVRKAGNQVRISAQLVNAANGFEIWSSTFDRTMDDVFGVQEEIAGAIAAELKMELAASAAEKLDPAAVDLYLQGRYAWNKRTEAGIRSAIDFFKRAIDIEPDYASAYAGLADAYVVLPGYSDVDADFSFEEAQKWAKKALEINPKSAEALTSLAAYHSHLGEHDESLELYEQALDLDPDYATARQWYGSLLFGLDRYDDGIEQLEIAQQLDPTSRVIRNTRAGHLNSVGRYEEAFELVRQIGEMDPDYPVFDSLGVGYYRRREFKQAIDNYEKLLRTPKDLRIDDFRRFGDALHYEKRYKRELEVARMGLEQHPQSWSLKRVESQALIALDRADEALRNVRAFIDKQVPEGDQALNLFAIGREFEIFGKEQQAKEFARGLLDWRETWTEEQLNKMRPLDMVLCYFHTVVGETTLGRRKFDAYAPFLDQFENFMPKEVFLGVSGGFAAMDGDQATARAREEQLAAIDEASYAGYHHFWQGAIAAALGESGRAVDLLRQAFEDNYGEFEDLRRMPFFKPIEDDLQFKAFLNEMGLG